MIKGEEDEMLSDRLSFERIRRGDLEAFNVVDVSRITRPDYDQNPFSAGYDRADRYIIKRSTFPGWSCSTVRRSSTGRP